MTPSVHSGGRFRALLLVFIQTPILIFMIIALMTGNPGKASSTNSNILTDSSGGGFVISEPISPEDTSALQPVAGDIKPMNFSRPDMLMLPGSGELLTPEIDSALQKESSNTTAPAYQISFDGIMDTTGIQPPDTVGQVGPNDYIQMVNSLNGGSEVGIYDKSTGVLKYPVFGMAYLFPPATPCRDYGAGDPVVLYDQLANRWILTQFIDPGPPYYECFAISKSSIPTNNPNDWWLYSMLVSNAYFNDYPKIAVWPDGYYMMAHQFSGGTAWAGTGVWVFDRQKMLNGEPASFQYKNLGTVNINYGGMLPGNLMGDTLPPIGSPNYFIEVDDNWNSSGLDIMHIFAFHVDWTNPNNTTFTIADQFEVAPYSLISCDGTRERCIDQPGKPDSLEVVGDRLMMHAWYRNRGGYEVILVNHTVNADGLGKAGVRWYEIRKQNSSSSGWNIFQQGTYAPDGSHRWMGGIAMDSIGNIALGYSVSSLSVYPSVRYTVRQPGDPLGTMGAEQSLVEGGSSTYNYRWGDYSSMTVDPVDDCTFWYTQEYIPAATSSWHTRIGAFRVPNCSKGPLGVLTGAITDSTTGDPLSGAKILATRGLTQTYPTLSQQNGQYFLNLLTGTYTITSSLYGYLPLSSPNITITQDQTTTLNLSLTPAPTATITGKVTDGVTGWPLYARISVTGIPENPVPPYNLSWGDLSTGIYRLGLVTGGSYTLTVEAVSQGYNPFTQFISNFSGNLNLDVSLQPNLSNCRAPGYFQGGFAENFDAVSPPALPSGWAKVSIQSTGIPGDWVTNHGLSPNLTDPTPAHSEPNLVYFNAFDAPSQNSARLYRTVSTNMTKLGDTALTFWMYHEQSYQTSLDYIQVQVSTDNGSSWINVGAPIYRVDGLDWQQYSISLAAYSNQTNLLIGFLGVSDWGMDIHIDDIALDPTCSPRSGGLVVGTITNGDNLQPLTESIIKTNNGEVYPSLTSLDPSVGGSFYIAYAPAGSQTITATRTGFGDQAEMLNIILGQTVRQDFVLYSGKLAFSPGGVSVNLNWGVQTTTPLTMTNLGKATAHFEITASVGGFTPLWPEGKPPYKRKIKAWPSSEHPFELLSGSIGKLTPVQPNLWSTVLSIPTGAVFRSTAASCDGQTIFHFGGQNTFGEIKNNAQKYDPASNTWTSLTPMPVALTNMQAVCIGEYIYLTGGRDSIGNTNEFQIYDTRHDTWARSSWPNVRTPMAAAYNRKLYVFGGSPGPSNETWSYDPQTNTWQNLLSPMPVPAEFGATATVGDFIYILGGAAGTELKKVQRYDPNTNSWSLGPDLPEARMSPVAAWYGNQIIVSSGGRVVNSVWTAYDTTYTYDYSAFPAGAWVKETDVIPQPVIGAASVCAHDRIYVMGGVQNNILVANNQFMDTGLKCHYGANRVPWLSFLPTTGSLFASPQNTNQVVNLTFNSADPSIQQPGSYSANLFINNDTVYGTSVIPITMTVQAPTTWGKLTGLVQNLGYCDSNPTPMTGISLTLESNGGITETLLTDNQGSFTKWLPATNHPVTVTVNYPGLQSSINPNIMITGGQETNLPINLRLLKPCALASLSQIEVGLQPGKTAQIILNLSNAGASSFTWEIFEIPGSTNQAIQFDQLYGLNKDEPNNNPLYASAPLYAPVNPALAIFQQDFESGLFPPTNWSTYASNQNFTWGIDQGNFAHSGNYGANVPWDYNQNEWLVSPLFTATEGVLSFWSKGSLQWCRETHDNCDLNVWLLYDGVGPGYDYLLGKADDSWLQEFVWSQSVFNLTSYLTGQPFMIGFEYLGNDGNSVGIDDIRLDGLSNSNVTWIEETPLSGTISADQSQDIQITLSANPQMPINSIYTATLQVHTSDLNNMSIHIPVTLRIVPYQLHLPILERLP